jgi:transcriptional regulator with XRE-family HTH domain
MTTIGDRVKAAREQRGLTQAELGKYIGLTADKVSKIEHGVREAGGHELLTIAEVTGVRYVDLLRDRVAIAFRDKDKRTPEEIEEALAVVDRFTDRWMEAQALERAFLL